MIDFKLENSIIISIIASFIHSLIHLLKSIVLFKILRKVQLLPFYLAPFKSQIHLFIYSCLASKPIYEKTHTRIHHILLIFDTFIRYFFFYHTLLFCFILFWSSATLPVGFLSLELYAVLFLCLDCLYIFIIFV